jgi:hypothetical protein
MSVLRAVGMMLMISSCVITVRIGTAVVNIRFSAAPSLIMVRDIKTLVPA